MAGGDVKTSHSNWTLLGCSRQSSTTGATQISPRALTPISPDRVRPATGVNVISAP